MFTGLVETIGIVSVADTAKDSVHLRITAPEILYDVRADHSVAVNGCCLTVEHCTDEWFAATAVKETLAKTNLGRLHIGSRVNLERAMKLDERLGGHLVSGHIDTTGLVTERIENADGCEMWIELPGIYRANLIPMGSVCVDGVSLTVAELAHDGKPTTRFKVALIPHTLAATTLGDASVGAVVNIELDMIGKYSLSAARYGHG